MLSSPAYADDPTTVRVVIERVEALDGGIDPDFPISNAADFYPIVEIDGQSFGGTSLEFSGSDDILPNWQFSRPVPLANSPISITIEMWDRDGGLLGADDEIDLTPGGDREIDLTVDLEPCAVSGDVSDTCWVTITTQGTDSDNARIRFRIEVGDPPAMAITTLTIERVIAQDSGIDPDIWPTTNEADFYPVVRIAGTETHGDYDDPPPTLVIEGDDDISPNWQFTKEVPLSLGSIAVDIEIWDDDAFLTFDDDQVDVSPLSSDRTLNLTVALLPCAVSGDVSGGCSTTITTSGDQSDDAEIRFRIDVEPPPTIEGFNMRCLHEPLWPQPGDSITITAEVLDDTMNPIPFTTGVTVEIWVDDQVAPDSTDTNVSSHTFLFTPAGGATQVAYGCAATTSTFEVWSGWHAVQIGSPATRAVPVVLTHSVGSAIDITFIPDRDNYTGANDASFITDAHDAILGSFYGDLFFLQNQRTFNFWLAQDMGDYEELCEHTTPSNWDSDYAFVESGAIIHTDSLRDCASFNQRIFSGEVGDWRVFLHEGGHQPFGEADEYCCDGWNAEVNPFPNAYETSTSCAADSINVGRQPSDCRSWTHDDGEDWFTSDPASNDLMVDNMSPQALDIRRIEWILNNCNSASC